MKKSYRKNVAVVVFNKNKELLVCKRIRPENAWQFPQGGIDYNEEIEAAAYRELKEETSITSVKTIAILPDPIFYDFPEDVRKNLWKHAYNKKFYGQEQYWLLLYFYGEDREINIKTEIPEFSAFEWKDKDFIINSIVDFKRQSYEQALSLFEKHIFDYKNI